ncbi:hypothetical protein [Puniceicoccus vermicola]|uniref:Uncharacterized protein n=1 Tax=Puniceicoccus vermicola TaxID=388746 RepID=A0A7X1B4F9_9BACT|nr:hypothetical protein [Puniceicoccus vermicola]MBC2604318.1 hypothetical protein [Puniceicoccus vermicola]
MKTAAQSTKHHDELSLRRNATQQLVSDFCHEWFDRNGHWIHPVRIQENGEWINPPQAIPPTYTRLVFWLCMGLMNGSGEDVSLGNAIMDKARFYSHNTPPSAESITNNGDFDLFDIFVTNHAMQMLAIHGEKLSEGVRKKVATWAKNGLRTYKGNRQADYQFHGFNDNMPAKATLGLILGGEYFQDNDALEHGLWNLEQLASILSRRGLISEYNSPTYTPFTLMNLSVIAQKARSAKAKELATGCCERIWAEILAHFHRPSGLMGGPFSRAAHNDSTGHLNTLGFLLWLSLDEYVAPNPIEEFQTRPIRLLHAHGFAPESLGRLSWVSSSKLLPPPHLLAWARNRTYPFHFSATAERGGSGERHANEILITHYQEEEFSLGSADADSWTQLQTEAFYLTYRKNVPAHARDDVRVAYSHYLVNEEAPRDPDHSLPFHGAIHTIQNKRTVLTLARPSLLLKDTEIQRMRLCVLIPAHFGRVDNLEHKGKFVFIEDGPVRYAIRALNPSDWGGAAELKVESMDNYLVISMENYNGTARRFSQAELERTLNGFVFNIARSNEESYEEFRERQIAAQCLDYWTFGYRTVCYQNSETRIEFDYAVDSGHVAYAKINGLRIEKPVWKADGMPGRELAFLGSPYIPETLRFPYRSLKVNWDPNAPWVIASNFKEKDIGSSGPGWRSQ